MKPGEVFGPVETGLLAGGHFGTHPYCVSCGAVEPCYLWLREMPAMHWSGLFKEDVARYREYGGKNSAVLILTQQGLWALLPYRMASGIYQGKMPRIIKRPLLLLFTVWEKCVEVVTGISLPYTAQIGRGFYIGHFGNIIINGDAVIGDECNISQGVTIGISGRKERRGVPRIGSRVYIGANATVTGRITIGDGAVIGANSLVTSDVPPGVTVVGVPASIFSDKDSSDYLHPSGRDSR